MAEYIPPRKLELAGCDIGPNERPMRPAEAIEANILHSDHQCERRREALDIIGGVPPDIDPGSQPQAQVLKFPSSC